MSTPPVPPDGDDLDPTGIRALLSSLPDPGPMPSDLVDRINASIAAGQSARENPTVVPLRRPRRWGWQHLGAAAAAAAAAAILVPALVTGTGPGDVLASLGGSGSSADSASGAAASLESGPDQGAAAPSVKPSTDRRVAASVGDVALEASGSAYTVAALASEARSRLSIAADAMKSPRDEAAGKADTGAGLRACLTALGVQGTPPLRGDVATLDGAPAVIVVVTGGAGQSVYAVSPECDGTHPMLLAGPVPLP